MQTGSKYRELLAIRHREIAPRLRGVQSGKYEILGESAVAVRWSLGDGSLLSLAANLTDAPLTSQVAAGGQLHWHTGVTDNLSFLLPGA
jgi:Domain of unknown function (DUF3459)